MAPVKIRAGIIVYVREEEGVGLFIHMVRAAGLCVLTACP